MALEVLMGHEVALSPKLYATFPVFNKWEPSRHYVAWIGFDHEYAVSLRLPDAKHVPDMENVDTAFEALRQLVQLFPDGTGVPALEKLEELYAQCPTRRKRARLW